MAMARGVGKVPAMSLTQRRLEAQQPMMTMVLFVDWECPASSNIIKTSDLGALEGLDQ